MIRMVIIIDEKDFEDDDDDDNDDDDDDDDDDDEVGRCMGGGRLPRGRQQVSWRKALPSLATLYSYFP